MTLRAPFLASLFAVFCSSGFALPREWIDPDTGHRVVQLSTEPGSACLYFTQYAYTAGGTKLILTTPKGVDLVSLRTGEIEHVLDRPIDRVLMAGRRSGLIYFLRAGAIWSLNPETRTTRRLAALPAGGSVVTVNADETLAAGAITEGFRTELAPQRQPGARGGDNYPDKHAMMDRRLAARLPMTLFTLDLRTGAVRPILHSTDWLNHFQFSPTDPGLLLYCHEGRQWKVDRVWMIRTDRPDTPHLVHQRTMRMEIAVHEYWAEDGQWVWYDLQTPLSEDCWLAGCQVYSGARTWYHLPPDHWCVHYNTSPDGRLFAGDGSDERLHYAHAHDAKWIFLFRPTLVPNESGETADQAHMIQAGHLTPERLVNLAHHDYALEPNANFTPDGKWIVFRSNLRGPTQVYAVEVAKASQISP